MKSFSQLAADLAKPGEEIAALMTADEAHLWHMATGVSKEAGELLDAVMRDVIYKKPLDRENVVEELGDLRFYMAGLMNALNISEAELLYANNAKLGKRYAAGSYSNEQAQERADKVGDNGLYPASVVSELAVPNLKKELSEDWVAREGRLAQYGDDEGPGRVPDYD